MAIPDLQEAVRFATQFHYGQWREGTNPLPYICHPIEVLGILRTVGGVDDDAMLCAAVLHDVIEETDATLAEVKRAFGKEVAKLVDELTRREPTPEEVAGMTKDEIWTLRAGMLLEDIAAMGSKAMTIKLCDRVSNLREAKRTKSTKKVVRYTEQSRKILAAIPQSVNKTLWSALKAEIEAV